MHALRMLVLSTTWQYVWESTSLAWGNPCTQGSPEAGVIQIRGQGESEGRTHTHPQVHSTPDADAPHNCRHRCVHTRSARPPGAQAVAHTLWVAWFSISCQAESNCRLSSSSSRCSAREMVSLAARSTSVALWKSCVAF